MSLHNDNALVVALDTSTDMLACAASWIDGQTGETKLVSGDHMCRRHANVELVNTVDGVLAQAGLDRSDVGYYVVGRGPGSFTGVHLHCQGPRARCQCSTAGRVDARRLRLDGVEGWRARQAWYLGRCHAR